MPNISQELQDILGCFIICEYQLRIGFSGAYALDYSTVIKVANDMGLKTDKLFYRLLRIFEGILIKELNRDNNGKK